jgi:protein NrfC
MPETKKPYKEDAAAKKKVSRRSFLATGSAIVAADVIISSATANAATSARAIDFYPTSEGYILYDSEKCASCTTCMLSCSLTHYGEQSLSLARIQIMQDNFGKFPDDIKMAPCRQCATPPCVINCPVGAAFVDTENGNVRRIDMDKCIGCKTCIRMCPQQPHRTVWNHIINKASKCDLCIDTPYWDEKGGVDGKQACVESCPFKALRFVKAMPDQKETDGYNVNLRNDYWYNLGLVGNSTHVPPAYSRSQRPQGKTAFKPKSKPKPGTEE